MSNAIHSRTTSSPAQLAGRPTAAESGPREPANSHAIRVLCVEDHPLVADGLRTQFAIDGRLEIIGHLSTAAHLVAEAQKLRPHAVLIDIEMPGPDAFAMIDRLRRECPAIRIIVLSAHARDSFVTAAFNAGACAYFTKSDDIGEIIEGVRSVVSSPAGAFLLGPTMKQRFAVNTPPAAGIVRNGRTARAAPVASFDGRATPLASLTPRELEILRLIGKGLGRVEIAAELSRSVKTVDGHQERIMKKLGITARAELMRLAIREGLAQA